jgi:hypothetical protein
VSTREGLSLHREYAGSKFSLSEKERRVDKVVVEGIYISNFVYTMNFTQMGFVVEARYCGPGVAM